MSGAAQRRDAAAWYAGRLPGSPLGRPDPQLAPRGLEVARDGVPGTRVPACAQCHGPSELADVPDNPRYPVLAGQHPAYLRTQLELFRRGVRGGSPYHTLMQQVAAHHLDDDTIAAVAAYYASLPSR